MAEIKKILKEQMEKIKNNMPKQLLDGDSEESDDSYDTKHDPDYVPEGSGKESEDEAYQTKNKRKKIVIESIDVQEDNQMDTEHENVVFDENNNSGLEKNNNIQNDPNLKTSLDKDNNISSQDNNDSLSQDKNDISSHDKNDNNMLSQTKKDDSIQDINNNSNQDKNNNLSNVSNNNLRQEESNDPVKQISKTKFKKRRGEPELWKANIRKAKRNKGEQYENLNGQLIPQKEFKDYNCLCPLKCSETVPAENRKKNFDVFYGCGSWDLQTAYINGHVKSYDVDRRYGKGSPSKSRRQKTRFYYLDTDNQSKRVCKNMFMNTLGLASARIHRALTKSASGCLSDLRGRHTAWNKLNDSTKDHVRSHIQSFPTYKSHYCRSNSDRDYLSPDLNVSRMYELYLEKCEVDQMKPVSRTAYLKIFDRDFNYSFKVPNKDACKTCDMLSTEIKAEEDKTESRRNTNKLEEDKKKHQTHLQESEKARKSLSNDKHIPLEDRTKATITFDLQKTLPTPKIPTGVAYYKRQLWVYNLGIHAYQHDSKQAYMFMWHEGKASRGAQEVSSCLKEFVTNHLPKDILHLTAWSDSCGGQTETSKLCLCGCTY